jgi:hypothetical protein
MEFILMDQTDITTGMFLRILHKITCLMGKYISYLLSLYNKNTEKKEPFTISNVKDSLS